MNLGRFLVFVWLLAAWTTSTFLEKQKKFIEDQFSKQKEFMKDLFEERKLERMKSEALGKLEAIQLEREFIKAVRNSRKSSDLGSINQKPFMVPEIKSSKAKDFQVITNHSLSIHRSLTM